jgi:hypothetical protein
VGRWFQTPPAVPTVESPRRRSAQSPGQVIRWMSREIEAETRLDLSAGKALRRLCFWDVVELLQVRLTARLAI